MSSLFFAMVDAVLDERVEWAVCAADSATFSAMLQALGWWRSTW